MTGPDDIQHQEVEDELGNVRYYLLYNQCPHILYAVKESFPGVLVSMCFLSV